MNCSCEQHIWAWAWAWACIRGTYLVGHCDDDMVIKQGLPQVDAVKHHHGQVPSARHRGGTGDSEAM